MDLRTLFYPNSIAIFGLSDNENNLGRMILDNLQRWNYHGNVCGVNPKGGTALGRTVYPTLAEVPHPVDLAVIITPARIVPSVFDQCAAGGIKHAIIETAGFSEYDDKGAAFADEVRAKATAAGIRFVGPNGIGIINAAHNVCLPFIHLSPWKSGKVSLIAQSGGVGLTILGWLIEHRMMPGKFVSIGNKYSLDETDYLEYLGGDPDTDIILMLLESLDRGARFVEVASRISKPILLMKTNITEAGAKRAMSHTAALANDDAVLDAALRDAGVVRVRRLYELVTYARMFSQPRIRGNRLGVISPAGGFTVLAADLAEKHGFEMPPFSRATIDAIRSRLRAGVINLDNPMDLGDALTSDNILLAVKQALSEENLDAVFIVYGRRPTALYYGAFEAYKRNIIPDASPLAAEYGKPLVFASPSVSQVTIEIRDDVDIPVYAQVEEAVEALAAYRDYCLQPPRKRPDAAPLSAEAEMWFRESPAGPALGARAFRLLDAAGIPTAAAEEVSDADAAARAATRMGYPVALKISSEQFLHKSDAGGVRLGIGNEGELRKVFGELRTIIDGAGARGEILVQRMAAPGGTEMILGMRRDPHFGPILLAGLGGVFVEVFRDSSLRCAPVTEEQAVEMLDELRGSALLRGARGRPPLDIAAVARAAAKLSQLAAASPRMMELDINPLLVYPEGQGCVAVDARVIIA